jgi:hypothetical protein
MAQRENLSQIDPAMYLDALALLTILSTGNPKAVDAFVASAEKREGKQYADDLLAATLLAYQTKPALG